MSTTSMGIYYPDGATPCSIADITKDIADSIDGLLGIAQVVYGTTVVSASTSSNSVFTKSGLTVDITPKYIDSEIFILVNLPFKFTETLSWDSPSQSVDFTLNKNSTVLSRAKLGMYGSRLSAVNNTLNISYPDTPNTLDKVTYYVSGRVSPGTSISPMLTMNTSISTIVAIEVMK